MDARNHSQTVFLEKTQKDKIFKNSWQKGLDSNPHTQRSSQPQAPQVLRIREQKKAGKISDYV